MNCPNCGQLCNDIFCANCGTRVRAQIACTSCGNLFDGTFCPRCGTKAGSDSYRYNAEPKPTVVINNVNNNSAYAGGWPGVSFKNRWVALILCIFFGFFGAHRFYVGKIGTGVFWLLTFGVFGFGWIVDIFVILLGGFRDAYGLYLK